MADEEVEKTQETEQKEEDTQIYKLDVGKLTIPINLGFVKSPRGIVVLVSLVSIKSKYD